MNKFLWYGSQIIFYPFILIFSLIVIPFFIAFDISMNNRGDAEAGLRAIKRNLTIKKYNSE